MKIDSRSYGGHIFRPTPVIFQDDRILIIATPWGDPQGAEHVVQSMRDYLSAAQSDVEATTLYQPLTCLSAGANSLRTAVLLANESLYRSMNMNDYTCGVEIFACVRTGEEVNWVQIGSPQAYLIRQNENPLPLNAHLDPALDFGSHHKDAPTLPSHLLGLDKTCNMTINGFRHQTNDRLMLVSRKKIPKDFYSLNSTEITLQKVSLLFAKDEAESPFWIADIKIGAESLQSEAA